MSRQNPDQPGRLNDRTGHPSLDHKNGSLGGESGLNNIKNIITGIITRRQKRKTKTRSQMRRAKSKRRSKF